MNIYIVTQIVKLQNNKIFKIKVRIHTNYYGKKPIFAFIRKAQEYYILHNALISILLLKGKEL